MLAEVIAEHKYDYSYHLKKSQVLVILRDRKNYYKHLEHEIRIFSEKYGFTFINEKDLQKTDTSSFIVRHSIIVDGTDEPTKTVSNNIDLIEQSTSTTLAISYSSQLSFDNAGTEITNLKKHNNHKINYLLPTKNKDGKYTPSMYKLVDNSVCDSVRIKYKPRTSNKSVKLPNEIKDYFNSISELIDRKNLYHRAPTDGFIAARHENGTSFYITATKTSKIGLDLERICLIHNYDEGKNTIEYDGRYLPSSDCVEASIVFNRSKDLNYIIHTHASAQVTRNKNFICSKRVPPMRYGEPDLGYLISSNIINDRLSTDLVLLEDHGEFFYTKTEYNTLIEFIEKTC